MRLTGVGSQYLVATLDAEKTYFDGGKTYKVTLPPNIPEKNFWSIILYDNQTRSMLQTPATTSAGRPTIPKGRQSELPEARSRGKRRRLHHHLHWSQSPRRGQGWQLDSERTRQGLFRMPTVV
jgi:hypothetical protein